MKKLLILLLCVSMLLIGCNDNSTPLDTENESTVPPTQTDDGNITAVSAGTPLIKICCSTYAYLDNAESMQKLLAKKTGVTFEIVERADKLDGCNAIFVGAVSGRDEIRDIFKNNISYNGYGAVFDNGNVYICGYTETAINKATQMFANSMKSQYVDKNAEGGISVVFDKSMEFVNNPEYEISDPKLLGASLADYSVAIAATEDKYLKELINNIIVKELGEQSGAYIYVVSDADDAEERAITVELDVKMELLEYSVKSNNDDINVKVGGMIAAYAAFEDIKGMLTKDTSSGISLTANAKDTFLEKLPVDLSDGATLRVMSANVMGAGLEEDGQCGTAFRSALLAEYIFAFEPDSVGLQEYNSKNRQYMGARISSKYATVSFSGYGTNWVSTIYRKDKYTAVANKMISIKVDGGQDYYFSWVALKDKSTGDIYIHGNLHLDYRGDTYRAKQAELINAELKKVIETYPNAIIAITGDYNCKWSSSVMTKLVDGLGIKDAAVIAPEGKADNKHKSYYKLCTMGKLETGSYDAIDHVNVTENTTSVKLHKIIYDALICHASDHYPVIVDIAKR